MGLVGWLEWAYLDGVFVVLILRCWYCWFWLPWLVRLVF